MGLWGLYKKNEYAIAEKTLPNRELLYISYDEDIPELHRGAYFEISFDEHGKFKITDKSRLIPDPSTIYIHLPIAKEYDAAPMPYYPHYLEMTPGQRYVYLNWLRNVEQPIDMGYVFIYYYGLERHMLTDDFDSAFDEIIKLRNSHNNKSFRSYSINALIHAAILRRRTDRLVNLHELTEIEEYSNAMFFLARECHLNLGASQLALIFNKAFTLSRKDIKTDKELFQNCIVRALRSVYGGDYFEIQNYDLSKTRLKEEARFANYSFSPEIQYVKLPDLYQCKELIGDLEVIFRITHDFFKQETKTIKSDKTPEEIQAALLKRNENRYKKLLKEKRITDLEYKLLSEHNKHSN